MEKRLNKNEFSDWMHEEMLLNKEANLLSNYFAYKGYIDLGFSKQKAQSMSGLSEEQLTQLKKQDND
jgi:hypothetical protein